MIFLAGSFEERASEMPEEFKNAIFSISNEEGLPSQNYKCYQCDTPIGIIYGPAAVCCFTGKYYCSKCHINDVSYNLYYLLKKCSKILTLDRKLNHNF